MTYPIMFGDENVGSAAVEQRGLYWYFRCRCCFGGQAVMRLVLRVGDREENLGIPVPDNGVFRLDKRIAVRSLPKGQWRIFAVPKHGALDGKFVPISPEEPFGYLHRLENAYFLRKGDLPGAVISVDQNSNG